MVQFKVTFLVVHKWHSLHSQILPVLITGQEQNQTGADVKKGLQITVP